MVLDKIVKIASLSDKRCHVIIGDTIEEGKDYILKKYNVDIGDTTGYKALCFRYPSSTGSTIVNILLKKDSDVIDMSHECIHAAWDLLDYVGIKVNVDNQEVLTYLHDYLLKETIKIHKKHGSTATKDNEKLK